MNNLLNACNMHNMTSLYKFLTSRTSVIVPCTVSCAIVFLYVYNYCVCEKWTLLEVVARISVCLHDARISKGTSS